MKCKEVTSKIDLHEIPNSFFGKIEFWFHIGICGACKNYLRFSTGLRKALRSYIQASISSERLNLLTKSLVEKFTKK